MDGGSEEEQQQDLVVLAITRSAAAVASSTEDGHELHSFGAAYDQGRRQDFAAEAANAAEELGAELVVVHEPWPLEQPAWELWGRWLAELEHVEVPSNLTLAIQPPESELPFPVVAELAPAVRLALSALQLPEVLSAVEAAEAVEDETDG